MTVGLISYEMTVSLRGYKMTEWPLCTCNYLFIRKPIVLLFPCFMFQSLLQSKVFRSMVS